MVKVWDGMVRLLHWTLVASVAAAWISSEVGTRFHEPVGYLVLGALAVRVGWGFSGTRYARFRQFVRPLSCTGRYARRVWRGHAPRYIGHNPLGGWMVVGLLACAGGTVATGWLFTTDRFWGNDTVATAHRVLAWAFLGLIVLHVAGVIVTGRRHHENLVAAMFSGNKRRPGHGDVD